MDRRSDQICNFFTHTGIYQIPQMLFDQRDPEIAHYSVLGSLILDFEIQITFPSSNPNL